MELKDVFAVAELVLPPSRASCQTLFTGEKFSEEGPIVELVRWNSWLLGRCFSHGSVDRIRQISDVFRIDEIVRDDECRSVRTGHLVEPS